MAEDVDKAAALVGIAKLFIWVAGFWALFDQHASTWVLQARDMDRTVGSFTMAPSQMQAIQPLLDLIMILVYQYCVYPPLRRLGVTITPLRCMSVGMVCTSFSFVIIAILQAVIDAGGRPSILWQVPAHVILTSSEVLVSVTGLEFAYTQAPPGMKSTVMSFWLLTTFGGNVLDAWIAVINVFHGASFFIFFAILMLVVAALFIWTAAGYQVQDFSSGVAELSIKRHLSDAAADVQWQDLKSLHAPPAAIRPPIV